MKYFQVKLFLNVKAALYNEKDIIQVDLQH